jgi:ubiquinone/menaquinone biosynthesis C-methylase UbiE
MACYRAIAALLVLSFMSQLALGQELTEQARIPPALQKYMGRRIAYVMGAGGADWLIRANRQQEEDCELLLSQLRLTPGMTVCDMGCGNGFYTLKMAKLVGKEGSVLAVDIQAEMLRLLQSRAEEEGIENVRQILGTLIDPRLPDGKVDLILCVDVYHEFSHPEHMLIAMRKSLSPKGVIALAEYREEDPTVPIKPLHKMSKKQILKEYGANGLKLVREFDGLPWQHLMFFGRDDVAEEQTAHQPATKSQQKSNVTESLND